jgi:hypothetical protein
MSKSSKPWGHELKQLFPIWLFFFLAFSLLRLTQSVILEEMGINLTTPSLVLMGSLIVAKAFLVLDWFSFVERYQGKPLIFAFTATRETIRALGKSQFNALWFGSR